MSVRVSVIRKAAQLVAVPVVLVIVLGLAAEAVTPNPGQIGVVRNGQAWFWPPDWFDDHNIRQIIKPGAGMTWTGLGSQTHWYPADTVQRNYAITSNLARVDRAGVDVVEVPTSDGVRVGLEGTFYFTTNFNGSPQGGAVVRSFDERFGVRQFRANGSTISLYPWDGRDGWVAFLDQVIRPIIDNDLRQSIATVSCAELVSACALVHQQTLSAIEGRDNNANIQKVQDAINASLRDDVRSTLGGDYFSNIQFRLSRVALPGPIQNEIDNAQAQFAAVGTAQAKVQQATLEAKANEERQKGYRGCPACAQIDELKAIPSNVTTFAPGTGFAVTPGA